jgi:hypothetical protein
MMCGRKWHSYTIALWVVLICLIGCGKGGPAGIGVAGVDESAHLYTVMPEKEAKIFKKINPKHATYSERFAEISAEFLGARYADDPIGEGYDPMMYDHLEDLDKQEVFRVDKDPPYRLHYLNGLSLIEQSLALTFASSHKSFMTHLKRIRYSGLVASFLNRKFHVFPTWLQTNVVRGYIRPILDIRDRDLQADGKVVHLARNPKTVIYIDLEEFFQRQLQTRGISREKGWDLIASVRKSIIEMRENGDPFSPVQAWMIPTEKIKGLASKIKNGDMFFLVNPAPSLSGMRMYFDRVVTEEGIFIRKDVKVEGEEGEEPTVESRLFVRRFLLTGEEGSREKRLMDQPFDEFLKSIPGNVEGAAKTRGLAIYRVTTPSY